MTDSTLASPFAPVGGRFVNSVMFQIDEGEDVASEEEENGFEERKDEGSDDDGGWITPSNIKQIQRDFEQCTVPKDVRVGCVTTDFAMQVGGRASASAGLSVIPVPARFGGLYRVIVLMVLETLPVFFGNF